MNEFLLKVKKYLNFQTFKIFTYIVYIFTAIHCVMWHLTFGGRWDTGMPLGMVDNFLNGGTFYTDLENVTATSPYFPGNVFVAFISRILFHYNAETAMIIFGGLVSVFLIWGLTKIASDDDKLRFYSGILCVLFFVFEFGFLKYYLLEIHPDLTCVCFFLFGVILAGKFINKKFNLINYISIICLFFISALFKQSSIFLFMGLFFYLLFTKSIELKSKLWLISAEIISGLLLLSVIFSMKNCWLGTVAINATFPFMTISEFLSEWKSAFYDANVFLILLSLFIILFILKKVKLNTELQRLWFYPAIVWMLLNILYPALREGANMGDIEAAVFPMAPYVILTIFYIIKITSKSKIINELKNFIIIRMQNKNIRNVVIPIMSIALVIGLIYGISYGVRSIDRINRNYKLYIQRLNDEKFIANWLEENYAHKKVAYISYKYELLNNTSLIKSTDLLTYGNFSHGTYLTVADIENMQKNENWDLIITLEEDNLKDKWPNVFKHYKLVNTDNILPPPTESDEKFLVYEKL